MGLDVTYKGQQIAQLAQDGTLQLNTKGKYLEDDIGLSYTVGGGGEPVFGFIAEIPITKPVNVITYTLPAIALTYPVIWVYADNLTFSAQDWFYVAVLNEYTLPSDSTGFSLKSNGFSGTAICAYNEGVMIDGKSFNSFTGSTYNNNSGRLAYGTNGPLRRFVAKLYNNSSLITSGTLKLYGRVS